MRKGALCISRALVVLACAGLTAGGVHAAVDAWTAEFTAATQSLRKKDYAAAEGRFGEALRLAEAGGTSQQDRVITALNSLGIVSSARGNTADAERYYERAVQATEQKYGPQHPNTASPLLNLGIARMANGKLGESEAAFDRAWRSMDAPGRGDLRAALLLYHRGNARRRLRKFAGAERDLSRSLYIRERQSRDLSDVGRSFFALGMLYKDSGRAALEESMWRRYLDIRDRSIGPWDEETVTALRNYAAVLRRNGKSGLAAAVEKRAEAGADEARKRMAAIQ